MTFEALLSSITVFKFGYGAEYMNPCESDFDGMGTIVYEGTSDSASGTEFSYTVYDDRIVFSIVIDEDIEFSGIANRLGLYSSLGELLFVSTFPDLEKHAGVRLSVDAIIYMEVGNG